MSERRAQIAAAWRKAAGELHFRLTSPYFTTLRDGTSLSCLGLVHHFGAAFGTLIFVDGEQRPFQSGQLGDEYFFSILTDSYAQYDRELFVETLDDWGWFGPKELTPGWYTGKQWL